MDPRNLPIYEAEAAIVRALSEHRVLVLEGPTGSGKTTQLPKILQQAMIGNGGIIGMTQPRRIAAVSVAWRIAEELQVVCGQEVGYAIRFDDMTSSKTNIKIMTDGLLLQEARTDPDFSRYDVIIVDEAHERTLNIDVTLGLLFRALQRRPELRVVVSSATLQPELFRRYFEKAVGEVPVVSVDARPYPVEVEYHPARSDDLDAITEAASEQVIRICKSEDPGHILVFLSGEAAIRMTSDKIHQARLGRDVLVLPLFGKLTRAEQERIFYEPEASTTRKVVLATNIAETSITVPNVRFVIDSGVAKVPRFQQRTGISTLFEEGVSKASANQRAGRAGRTAPGKCIRLYSEKWFSQRPDFTDEEILRLDLTEVVMRLIDLGVREVETFPLPTRPRESALKNAIRTLQMMGAIDKERNLTRIGQKMMPFPLSPHLARMVVEAAERYPNVVDEVLMVAAFMSAHSPFLYPQGEEAEARHAQARLAHPLGDAMTAVNTLSRYLASSNPVSFCHDHYLDPDVMAFLRKAYGQLSEIAQNQGISIDSGGEPSLVVRSVAAGYAHQILRANGRVYEGLSDTPISIHPSSSLFGARAQFIVATDIVVSTRPYARNASMLKPEWVAEANPDLAREWRLTVPKKKSEREVIPADAIPSKVVINGVSVKVEDRRGRPFLHLLGTDAPRLGRADLRGVPPAMLAWKAELIHSSEHPTLQWGRPMTLGKWLAILNYMPLPVDEPREVGRELPIGALLEVDRNLHTLERLLPRLLEPFVMSKGRQGGWLSLVSNGEGGFWCELVSDWQDALQTTLDSLRDLREDLPEGDSLTENVDTSLEALSHRAYLLHDALETLRRLAPKAASR